MEAPRRLTDQAAAEYPTGWTGDGAVVFSSVRNGKVDMFKQRLDSDKAELLATGINNVFYLTPATPDGSWLLNVTPPHDGAAGETREISRIPIKGGPPEPVMTDRLLSVQCAYAPAQGCVLEQPSADRKSELFSVFDPMKGRGRELLRMPVLEGHGGNGGLSPDGRTVAILDVVDSIGRIRLVPLDGKPEQEIQFKGWKDLHNINWAADGKGLLFAHGMEQDRGAVLVHVDFDGKDGPLAGEGPGHFYLSGIPLPDGRNVAIYASARESNIWSLEGF